MESSYAAHGTLGGVNCRNEASAVQPRKETQIADTYRRLETQIGELTSALDVLTERLCSVLHPCAPETSNKNSNEPRPAVAPLAEALDIQMHRVMVLRIRIVALLDRLEL